MSKITSSIRHLGPGRSNARTRRLARSCALADYALETLEPRTLMSVNYLLSTLTTFSGATGSNPQSGLLADASGNLYGTTRTGGANDDGTVFEVAATTHNLTTLVTFNGSNGQYPEAGLIADATGNLYGTTNVGGANSVGTVFEVAADTHTLTTLATFTGTNGAFPQATLLADAGGNLYGTTWGGGAGYGTVFQLASGSHALSTIATFNNHNGNTPQGGLVADASGNLYGTTYWGGDNNLGTVFEVAVNTHVLTAVVSFNGPIGSNPQDGLITDSLGNLYGTTALGGANGDGTVFTVAADTHALTTLVSFDGANGLAPESGLIADAGGDLFGTTYGGGASSQGSIFELAAGTHTLTTLLSFNGTNGANPQAGLIVDAQGDLFGTTNSGGANNDGTVFELFPAPTQLAFTQPPANSIVGSPLSPAIIVQVQDANGNLVTSDHSNVTLSIATGTGNLQGTLTVAAVHGLATFNDLSLGSAGTYTLQAVDGALTPATSASFRVSTPALFGSSATHLIVTGPDAGDTTDGPLVKVFDATTGNLNFSFLAYGRGFLGAVRVAMGDFNSDGTPDIVTATGSGGQPLVNVYDGKTGTLFAQFYAYSPDYLGGVEIAVADVTGAGHPDIITSTDAGGVPLVNVFNSAGTLLLNFYAYDPNYLGGVRIASGDFSGNGQAQIVTATANGGLPLVNVFNGVGTLVGNFWGDTPSYMGGLQITVGNFTSDSLAKVATYRDQATSAQVKLFNLSTQQQFNALTLGDSALPLHLRLAATDANGDGIADIVTAPTSGSAPVIEVFSGVDGSLIRQWSAYASTVTCGLFVAAA